MKIIPELFCVFLTVTHLQAYARIELSALIIRNGEEKYCGGVVLHGQRIATDNDCVPADLNTIQIKLRNMPNLLNIESVQRGVVAIVKFIYSNEAAVMGIPQVPIDYSPDQLPSRARLQAIIRLQDFKPKMENVTFLCMEENIIKVELIYGRWLTYQERRGDGLFYQNRLIGIRSAFTRGTDAYYASLVEWRNAL